MEYLGTMLGHGKPITRKGTKGSGLGFTAEFAEGQVKINLYNVNDKHYVDFVIYKDGIAHTMSGTFDSLFEVLRPEWD